MNILRERGRERERGKERREKERGEKERGERERENGIWHKVRFRG